MSNHKSACGCLVCTAPDFDEIRAHVDKLEARVRELETAAVFRYINGRGHRIMIGSHGSAIELASGSWAGDNHLQGKQDTPMFTTEAEALAFVTGGALGAKKG